MNNKKETEPKPIVLKMTDVVITLNKYYKITKKTKK